MFRQEEEQEDLGGDGKIWIFQHLLKRLIQLKIK